MLKSNLTEWLVIMLVVMVICLNSMDNLHAQSEGLLPENSPIQNKDESQDRIAYTIYRMVPYKTPEGELKYKRVPATRYVSQDRILQVPDSELKILMQQIPTLLATAKTEDEKQVMKSDLKKRLLDYFEKDLAERESKLKPLEDRVKKLREQIDKRRAAKEELVDLQLKLIEHQAEGLGFFTEPNGLQIQNSKTSVEADSFSIPTNGLPEKIITVPASGETKIRLPAGSTLMKTTPSSGSGDEVLTIIAPPKKPQIRSVGDENQKNDVLETEDENPFGVF